MISTLKKWLKDLQGRPKPVITSASVSAAITFVVGVAVTYGFIPAAQSAPIVTAATSISGSVFTIIASAGTLLAALHASSKVTPLADPVNAVGKALVSEAVSAVQTAHLLDGTSVSLGNVTGSLSASTSSSATTSLTGVANYTLTPGLLGTAATPPEEPDAGVPASV